MGSPHPSHLCAFSNSSEKISFSALHFGHLQTNDCKCLKLSKPGQCWGVVIESSFRRFHQAPRDRREIALAIKSASKREAMIIRYGDPCPNPHNPVYNKCYLEIHRVVYTRDIFPAAYRPPFHSRNLNISSWPRSFPPVQAKGLGAAEKINYPKALGPTTGATTWRRLENPGRK